MHTAAGVGWRSVSKYIVKKKVRSFLSQEKWLGPPVTLRHLPMADRFHFVNGHQRLLHVFQRGAGAPASNFSPRSMHSCGDHHGADCWQSCANQPAVWLHAINTLQSARAHAPSRVGRRRHLPEQVKEKNPHEGLEQSRQSSCREVLRRVIQQTADYNKPLEGYP